MSPTLRRAWAVLGSAVAGIALGSSLALAGADAPAPRGSAAPSEPPDPLGLGVDLVDQDCTGAGILVVGTGDSTAPLRAGIADNPDVEVRYLRTAESCDTVWVGEKNPRTPAYVAYLGPYDTLADGCEDRLTVEHRGDVLTVLSPGTTDFVKCACVLPNTAGPRLRPGIEPTARVTIWTRQLQSLLVDLDDGQGRFEERDVTGVYDERTVKRITTLQRNAALVESPEGVMDADTWKLVKDRTCGKYDF